MKYSIILADPPWYYSQRANHKTTRFKGGARGHYSVMKTADISALNIGQMAADNCALFLWATMPNFPQALDVIKAWGFKYKTVAFTWVKTNPKTNGKIWLTNRDFFFGIGYYTKSNAELCLLAIKGRMKPVSNSVSSVIVSPRREHSRKPDEARERIVQLFGDLPRIELFARQRVSGWDAWGNEVESDIEIPKKERLFV